MANTQTQAVQPAANAPANVQVVPSGKAVGAEIRGVDLAQPVPEATKELMRQAWAEHGVLWWRDQKLPDISCLEAAGLFGRGLPRREDRRAARHFLVGGVEGIEVDRDLPRHRNAAWSDRAESDPVKHQRLTSFCQSL